MSTASDFPRTGSASGTVSQTLRARLPQVREHYRLHPLVVIYLITVMVPLWFHLGPLNMNIQRSFLLVMFIPLLIKFLSGQAGRFIASDYLFFFVLIWFPISLSQTSPSQAISFSGSVGMEFIGGYLIGRLYIRSRESFLALCRWLVLIILCLLPLALVETLTNRPPLIEFLNRLPAPFRGVSVVQYPQRMGFYRAQTVFAHPILSGLFCSIGFSLCYIALKDVYSTTRRLVSSALVFLVGFLALSSGALLALFLQLALIGWAAMFRKVQARWWLLVGLFVLLYIVIDIISTRTPLRVFMSYATFSAHNAFWRSIIFEWGMMNIFGSAENGIPAARLFGIGFNDWVRPHFMPSSSVDNYWLAITMRNGVPAGLANMFGYGLIVMALMRCKLDDCPKLIHIRRAMVFTFLGLAFTLCTVHIWTQVYSFVHFMLGASVWLLDPKVQERYRVDASPEAESTTQSAAELAGAQSRHLPHTRFQHRPMRRDAQPLSTRQPISQKGASDVVQVPR